MTLEHLRTVYGVLCRKEHRILHHDALSLPEQAAVVDMALKLAEELATDRGFILDDERDGVLQWKED